MTIEEEQQFRKIKGDNNSTCCKYDRRANQKYNYKC